MKKCTIMICTFLTFASLMTFPNILAAANPSSFSSNRPNGQFSFYSIDEMRMMQSYSTSYRSIMFNKDGYRFLLNEDQSVSNIARTSDSRDSNTFFERHDATLLALGLVYTGICAGFREGLYRKHPENNRMGTVNAYALTMGTALFAGTVIGAGMGAYANSNRNTGELFGGFIGIGVGAAAGIMIMKQGKLPHYFKKYRALYYTLPAISLTVGVWAF